MMSALWKTKQGHVRVPGGVFREDSSEKMTLALSSGRQVGAGHIPSWERHARHCPRVRG